MHGMGYKGEVDQTSKAGQFLRLLHYGTWKKLYIQFFEQLQADTLNKRLS